MLVLLATALALALSVTMPSGARAADCSLADYDYNGVCGPEFETPAWGDGAGWTDPSKYSTIQLADLTGNGVDELIARNDDGIEIWTFDTKLGQWRPATDVNGQPEVLTDFGSPLPSQAGPNWTQAPYYSTIQTVDLSGNGAHEIVARFPSGMRAYKYTPPAGSQDINGGTWSLISQNGPFSDAAGYADPSLYLSIHALSASNGQPARLMAQSPSGVVVYDWSGTAWTKDNANPSYSPYTADPSSYLDLQWATISVNGKQVPAIVQRNGGGVHVQYEAGGKWVQAGQRPNPGPFADGTPPSVDCPFTNADQNFRCFGSSPSYYETLRFANIDGQPGEQMLGRTSDGLRVDKLSADGSTWAPLAKLTALGGSAFGSDPPPPGRWASIQTAQIGAGSATSVLALDRTGLQAYSYNAQSNSWTHLTPSAPLQLGGAMWDTNASYYSTIQSGDVTGDGHDAVIARGPFGIRTWFYNLHGNSGWTSWLPQDTTSYPQFTGAQAAAFTALNSQVKDAGLIPQTDTSVRDFWTGGNAPSSDKLSALQTGIVGVASCSGATKGGPPYSTCVPPMGSTGFTAADWTAVVNEVLTEIVFATSADDFFGELDTLRQHTFIAQGAELDSIATNLGIEGAAGNQTTVQPGEIASAALEILGALVTLVPGAEEAAVPLEAGGVLLGVLDSTSPTLNSQFTATWADLKDEFATMITEIDKGLEVQSQEVRQSYGLLSLLAQLTAANGLWGAPDLNGMQSASNQGFAEWTYKQLLPTMYARFVITNCADHFQDSNGDQGSCGLLPDPPGPDTIGGGSAFTTVGAPPQIGFNPQYPCHTVYPNNTFFFCDYSSVSDANNALAQKVWGPLSDTCKYQGPNFPATIWTFGCNVGVNKNQSVSLAGGSLAGWNFTSYCAAPLMIVEQAGDNQCAAPSGQVTVGRNGAVRLTGAIKLPRGFQVTGGAILPNGLLAGAPPFAGDTKLLGATPGRTLTVVHVRGHDGRRALATSAHQNARLLLPPATRGHQRYTLAIDRTKIAIPAPCRALRASDSLNTAPFALTSRVRLSDGARTLTLALTQLWRCVRHRGGSIGELRPARPRRLHQRPGLRVSLVGPGRVTPGTEVTYLVRLHNLRSHKGDRLVTELWHLAAQGSVFALPRHGSRTVLAHSHWRIPKLRAAKSRVLRLRAHVPVASAGRLCVAAGAVADSARPASARLCARVQPAPRGGLG